MSRRRKHFPDTRTAAPVERPNLTPENPLCEIPETRKYDIKNRFDADKEVICKECIEWRIILGRKNRVHVKSTQGRVRYCVCLNCRADIKHASADNSNPQLP